MWPQFRPEFQHIVKTVYSPHPPLLRKLNFFRRFIFLFASKLYKNDAKEHINLNVNESQKNEETFPKDFHILKIFFVKKNREISIQSRARFRTAGDHVANFLAIRSQAGKVDLINFLMWRIHNILSRSSFLLSSYFFFEDLMVCHANCTLPPILISLFLDVFINLGLRGIP